MARPQGDTPSAASPPCVLADPIGPLLPPMLVPYPSGTPAAKANMTLAPQCLPALQCAITCSNSRIASAPNADM